VIKYIYDAWGNHKVVDNNGNEFIKIFKDIFGG